MPLSIGLALRIARHHPFVKAVAARKPLVDWQQLLNVAVDETANAP